jgi:hypothetical protein
MYRFWSEDMFLTERASAASVACYVVISALLVACSGADMSKLNDHNLQEKPHLSLSNG